MLLFTYGVARSPGLQDRDAAHVPLHAQRAAGAPAHTQLRHPQALLLPRRLPARAPALVQGQAPGFVSTVESHRQCVEHKANCATFKMRDFLLLWWQTKRAPLSSSSYSPARWTRRLPRRRAPRRSSGPRSWTAASRRWRRSRRSSRTGRTSASHGSACGGAIDSGVLY